MSILDILNQLNSNRSRNFKLQLLTEHQDNELLKKVIKLALDPFVVFYIKKVPAYHSLPHAPWKLDYAITLLDELTSRAVTGHEAINHLKYVLQNVTDDDAEVIKRIPGTGKNTGLMGALVCRSGDIEFNVGTGFTEQERKEFTADYIVGKIITVTYNQVITEKTSERKSLFLPRFNCIRFDKDTI
mgnify:CR=1 FL=1